MTVRHWEILFYVITCTFFDEITHHALAKKGRDFKITTPPKNLTLCTPMQ